MAIYQDMGPPTAILDAPAPAADDELMKHRAGISEAYWLGPRSGCILLHKNWERDALPRLELSAASIRIEAIRFADVDFVGRHFGYYEREDGKIVFCQDATRHRQIDFEKTPVRVAGPFNNWGQDGPWEAWTLRPRETAAGDILWECAVDRDRLGANLENVPFKFVSSGWHWLKVQPASPNRFYDEAGNANYRLEGHRTGRHVILFETSARAIHGEHAVSIAGPWRGREVLLHPGLAFYDLETDLPLGAHVEHRGSRVETVFRLFAPRAQSVELEIFDDLDNLRPERHAMTLLEDELTWEVRLPGNRHGAYYHLYVAGDRDVLSSHFDAAMPLLDPWALASVGPTGPAIVIDRGRLPRPRSTGGFEPPHWHDLVIVEGHVRDLVAKAPIDLTEAERRGFRGLQKWVEAGDSYLRRLGANALELQPVSQFDVPPEGDYHWGYVPNNYFSPAAEYALHPERGSQIKELHDLVQTCHRQGIAVILDVVYNHVGEPAYLLFIDKAYYFHVEPDGSLSNWSGCGNTLRAESAMARRLIIESLIHLIETYDIDGFRFDLAELISVEVLAEIEAALKAVKPSVVLIAEPWSFRGHIAWRLQSTGWAFWNDGYREFMAAYLRGGGDAGGLRYYMHGCLDHLTRFPAQSVNYVASHDDRCWIDKITENPDFDGTDPTPDDIHRSHLMIAVLMTSLGIPMITAGMDFLQSKGGFNNSYLRGDLNALDYARAERFGLTASYFRSWIAFRLSEWGAILRLREKPPAGYLTMAAAEDTAAAALLFNADHSQGPRQILFAINPHTHEVDIPLPEGTAAGDPAWLEVADRNTFNLRGVFNGRLRLEENRIHLGPLDCGLWIRPSESEA
ncbi:MAG: glycoside hydrolase family 1 [Verrucomicrobia bacterium]|nr:MAG: glycoside hydrolase family 1 [Verrucomicrobiota bacterium]